MKASSAKRGSPIPPNIILVLKQIMTVEPEKKMETINNSFLEVARQDHIEILKEIKR